MSEARSTAPGRSGAGPRAGAVLLRWAVWLLLVQAVGVAVETGFVVYAAFTETARTLGTALSTIAVPLGFTILLALLGWHLHRRRSWARGAAIVLQLLMVLTGATLITSGLPLLGVPTVAVAVTGAALLLAPSSREALGIH